jgi:YHS domain-containing protein
MSLSSTPPTGSALDPVCGKTVPLSTIWVIHHGSVTFHLCSLSCALRFKEDPDGFAALAAADANRTSADPPHGQ